MTLKDYENKVLELRKKYPGPVIHKLLIFGVPGADLLQGSKNVIPVLSSRLAPITSLGTVMCDITTDFLAELAVLAITREMGSFKSPGLMELEHPVSRFQDGKSYNGGFTNGSQSNGSQSISHSPAGSFSSITSSRIKSGSISIGLNDRSKAKQYGRSKKYLAGLYLITGRWQDALREFSEAASSLKTAHDHLWHASALEGIGICLLLLSFLEVPTAIPSIALQAANVSSHSSTLSFSDSTDSLTPTASNSGVLPPSMFEFLPELTNSLLRIYARSQGSQEESIPQIVFCETILRFVNLLSITRLCGGWNPASLSAVVRGTPVSKNVTPDSPSITAITSWINRAYATDLSSLPLISQCSIFSGIAVIYSNIGLVRKRSFVMREMLLTIIPRLSRVRSMQAASSSVHSEGFTDVEKQIVQLIDGEREGGIVELLDNLCKVYGAGDITSVGYGWIQLRVSFLKTCLFMCEAIPDYNGIIHFASLLLSTASDVLSANDQIQIYQIILRAVDSARKLGHVHVSADYWDPNILRDIKIVSTTSSILPQFRNNTAMSTHDDSGFFIHNPFASKKPGSINKSSPDLLQQNPQQQQPRILVQNERADFLIRLQNPFAFDLHVLEITLLTRDVSVSARLTSLNIPANSISDYTIPVIPEGTGTLKIIGASIQIGACAKKDFFLSEKLPYVVTDKVESVGSSSGKGHGQTQQLDLVKNISIDIDIISAQPVMVLKNISLNQGWMMLLEGEKQLLTITLANISEINANYVSLKFSDSTTPPLQVALSNKDLPQNEIYEVEYFLYNRKALQWIQGPEKQSSNITDLADLSPIVKQTKPSCVSSHNAKVFNILVLGKRGMNQGAIQVEYANRDNTEDESTPFWLRMLSIPINITVNSSIELGGCDMMSLRDNQVFTDDPSVVCASTLSKYLNVLKDKGKLAEYCLLVVDLRNSWTQSIEVTLWSSPEPRENDSFEVDVIPANGKTDEEVNSDRFLVKEIIHAGKTSRLLVPVKRVEFTEQELSRPIPSLSVNKRQFVVNPNINPERARATRENFWYRNVLLSMLGGAWRVLNGTPRSGILELRGIRLTRKMISILRVESVSLTMSLEVDGSASGNDVPISDKDTKQLKSQYVVKAEEDYFTLYTTIQNRTSRPISGYLRVIPMQRYPDVPYPNTGLLANGTVSNADFENWNNMDTKILYNGSLQQAVYNIAPGKQVKIGIGAMFLSRGEYEFSSVFDEFNVDKYEEEVCEEKLNKDVDSLSISQGQDDYTLDDKFTSQQHEQRDPVYIHVV